MSLLKTGKKSELAIWSFDEVNGKWIAYADYLALEKRTLLLEKTVKELELYKEHFKQENIDKIISGV